MYDVLTVCERIEFFIIELPQIAGIVLACFVAIYKRREDDKYEVV